MWAEALVFALLTAAPAQQQQTPVPQPFPRPGGAQPAQPAPAQPPPAQRPAARPQPPPVAPAPAATPAAPAPAAPAETAPTESVLGVPVYPGAQFLASYNAGRGQRYYIFGSAASFTDLVTYYRTVLKQKGDLVFESLYCGTPLWHFSRKLFNSACSAPVSS